MEQIQLLNRLEEFHHINQRPFNQSISMFHLEPFEQYQLLFNKG
jgi:hypothetical protein